MEQIDITHGTVTYHSEMVGTKRTSTIYIPPNYSARDQQLRQCISINEGWRFMKYDSRAEADSLIYDVRQ